MRLKAATYRMATFKRIFLKLLKKWLFEIH